jgi:glycosyltransferase involved in cell wall biosynthesis
MSQEKTIIFIKPTNSSFITTDQGILEKYYRVIPYLMNQNRGKAKYFLNLLSLAFFLLKNASKSKAFVCWFGDYHAAVMVFMANLTGKASVVLAGGQEAICYQELGKGVYLKRFRGFLVKYSLRNCSLILPNHKSLIYHENSFYNSANPHIDGIKYYVKGIRGEIRVVPNGIDSKRIDRNPEIPKDPNLVLTVGTMNKLSDFYNKGYDLFFELARRCKNQEFVAIGVKRVYLDWIEEQHKISEIKNLKVIPSFCPDEVLSEYFNKAKVYLQVSITEGMPVSLGEAMLCECIPIGSNVNGIPDAIGNTGVIVYKRDLDDLESALKTALGMNTGHLARLHTLENYSIDARAKKLYEVLEDHLKIYK